VLLNDHHIHSKAKASASGVRFSTDKSMTFAVTWYCNGQTLPSCLCLYLQLPRY
jgi:hypothetical protein